MFFTNTLEPIKPIPIPTMRPPSPLSLAWHKFGGGKAVEDIVKLFTQRQPEIAGFLSIFNTVRC
ncbi:LysR family transcriptional regulator [Salmonella enterica]|nr:LysR family transcriptional regulator [Salmonella enterica]EBI3840592.1 LysR family transcriptional regulator [Salmonella enterica]